MRMFRFEGWLILKTWFFLFIFICCDFLYFRIKIAEIRVSLFEMIADQIQGSCLPIILQFVNDIFHLPTAILLDEDDRFLFRDLDDLEIFVVLRVPYDFEKFLCKFYLDQHFKAIDYFNFWKFDLVVLAFVQLLDGCGPDSTAGLDAGEVELVIWHTLDDAFIVEPVPVEFLDVHCRLLLLQPLHETFILWLYLLELSFAIELVETIVDFGPDVPRLGHRVWTFLAHHTRNLLQEHLVFPLYFDIPHLFDHVAFALVYHNRLSVVHQLRSDGFDLSHVSWVIGVFDLLFFALHETVQIGSSSVHRSWLEVNKINNFPFSAQKTNKTQIINWSKY